MGRNSETAILLEKYVEKYTGPLMIAQDAADYFKFFPQLLMNRPDTVLVISLAQLQKIFINAPLITPIIYGMTQPHLAEALHQFTTKFPITIVVKHQDLIFVAHSGQVVSTPNSEMPWRVKTAGKAIVYWIQNPSQPLESISTSFV
jgi:hypothetical protein